MGKIDRQMNGLRDGKTNPLVVAKREEIQLNIQIEILNSKENLWNELYASKARWRNPGGSWVLSYIQRRTTTRTDNDM